MSIACVNIFYQSFMHVYVTSYLTCTLSDYTMLDILTFLLYHTWHAFVHIIPCLACALSCYTILGMRIFILYHTWHTDFHIITWLACAFLHSILYFNRICDITTFSKHSLPTLPITDHQYKKCTDMFSEFFGPILPVNQPNVKKSLKFSKSGRSR